MLAADKTQLLQDIDEQVTQQGKNAYLPEVIATMAAEIPEAQAAIADLTPGTATAEQCATAINSILAVMRTSGLLLE